MPDLNLTDVKLMNQVSSHEIAGHEIGGQDIYRSKIDYITMQCVILFKTTAEHKFQQQSKLYYVHMYNRLKCIKYYENISLNLATGQQ